MAGDVCGHRGLDRPMEAVATFVVTNPAAMGFVTSAFVATNPVEMGLVPAANVSARALAAGWLSGGGNLRFGDDRRCDRIAAAAPNSGSERYRVWDSNEDRSRDED